MNENIDLTKVLKDCPKGWEMYSSVFGKVTFSSIEYNVDYPIKFLFIKNNKEIWGSVTKEGIHNTSYNGECTLFPSKDQRDWSKFTAPWYKNEESIKPKFKVGDKIRHKEVNKADVYEINKVYDDSYVIGGFNWILYMKYQDQYELVPNKFDPKTLKTFDKVLVRDNDTDKWHCNFFSHIIEHKVYKYVTIIEGCYICCIPYNDKTKHLVGTSDAAPEYYRYW